MSNRSTSYRSIRQTFGTTPSGKTPLTKVLTAGVPIISVTVLNLTNGYQDANGRSFVQLAIGEGADPFVVEKGTTWQAQRDALGNPVPETTGLFVQIGDDFNTGSAPAIVVELYVELQRQSDT